MMSVPETGWGPEAVTVVGGHATNIMKEPTSNPFSLMTMPLIRSALRDRSPSYAGWLAVSLAVVALDQWTKAWIVEHFALGQSLPLAPFLDIVRWHNTGVAFSSFAGGGAWHRIAFIALGIAASVFILWMQRRHADRRLFCFALAMVLGGAVGNVIDRIGRSHVVDFIFVHWHDAWTFPAFNFADTAITLGAICLVLGEALEQRFAGGKPGR